MTKREWLSVGLKTAFLTAFMIAFSQASYFGVEFFRDVTSRQSFVIHLTDLIGAMVCCIVAFVFLRWSDVLVARTFPRDGIWLPGERPKVVFLVACRIAGSVFLLRTVMTVFSNTAYWLREAWEPSMSGGSLLSLFPVVASKWAVEFGLALYLLFGAKRLVRAAFAFGKAEEKPPDLGGEVLGIGSPSEVFSLALRVVGVVFLVKSLPLILQFMVIRVFPLTAQMYSEPIPWHWFFDEVFLVIACLYLITGARHFVRLVFRKAGEPRTQAEVGT